MATGSAKNLALYAALAVFLVASAASLVLVCRHGPGEAAATRPPRTQPEPQPPEKPPTQPAPEPWPIHLPVPPLASTLKLSGAEITGLIGTLREGDPFIEYDFTRRAGRAAGKLVQAGRPAWDAVAAALESENDEFARARLNTVLACMRWRFSPYFIFKLDPNFVGELYTREAPPRGEWFSSLETFLKAKDAPKLIHAFTLNDPDASFYIFDFVQILGPPALKPLLEALAEEHPYFHFCVTVALMRLAPHALPELRRLACDPDAAVRDRAVWALGLSGSMDAVGPLTRALGDEEVSVRSSAAFMLAMIPYRRAAPHLVKALKDPDDDTASMAADALGVIGDPAAILPLQEYIKSGKEDARRSGTSALAGIGQQGARTLLAFLKDPDQETRVAAANALSELRSPSTAPTLMETLSGDSEAVRSAAADALGYIGGEPVAQALVRALADSDPEVRSSAAYSLGRMRYVRATGEIATLLQDEDARVRMASISSIGKLGGARALEILIESLGDPELSPLAASSIKSRGRPAGPALIAAFPKATAEAKCLMAKLMAEMELVEAAPALIYSLTDPDMNVRFCADKALKLLTGYETSYKCDAAETERIKGQEEWRKWWEQNKKEKQD